MTVIVQSTKLWFLKLLIYLILILFLFSPRVLEIPVVDVAATSTTRNATPNARTATDLLSGQVVDENIRINWKKTGLLNWGKT